VHKGFKAAEKMRSHTEAPRRNLFSTEARRKESPHSADYYERSLVKGKKKL
jgi:hypothetical protein